MNTHRTKEGFGLVVLLVVVAFGVLLYLGIQRASDELDQPPNNIERGLEAIPEAENARDLIENRY